MNLQKFAEENDRKKTVDKLINECHALHFSIRMIFSLFLINPGFLCPTQDTVPPGLFFFGLNHENAEELANQLSTSLCALNSKIRDFIPKEHIEKPFDDAFHTNDNNSKILLLQKSLNDNLTILHSLKEYRNYL